MTRLRDDVRRHALLALAAADDAPMTMPDILDALRQVGLTASASMVREELTTFVKADMVGVSPRMREGLAQWYARPDGRKFADALRVAMTADHASIGG